jgi:hypothetical protein
MSAAYEKMITVKEFTLGVMRDEHTGGDFMTDDELFVHAYKNQLIDNHEYLHPDEKISRKAAAGIIHRVLLFLCEEMDDADISASERLADLYDCHTCVQHISQVFCKGIIDCKTILNYGKKENISIFDMNSGVTADEMKCILDRIWNKEMRLNVEPIQ